MSTTQLNTLRPNHGAMRDSSNTNNIAVTGVRYLLCNSPNTAGRAFSFAIACISLEVEIKNALIPETTAQNIAIPKMNKPIFPKRT